MANSSQLLVLVADENSATLYANNNGVTRQLRQIERISPMDISQQELDATPRHLFACELMMALGRCVRELDCNGVVIFSAPSMTEELRQVQTGTVTRMLLAHIVGKPTPASRFPGVSAANARLAYCGAVK